MYLKTCCSTRPVLLVGVERHLRAAGNAREAQRANIVEPEDVVRMAVGVEDRVDLLDLFAQCLFAEVRRGIDQHEACRRTAP